MSFHIKDYDYNLPDERIAQSPADQRDRSRLLVYDRKSRTIKHTYFTNLTNCLNSGDVLVINNTRVIPARLLGKKQTGGKIEVFILDYQKAVIQDGFTQCECMIRSSKPPKTGTRIYFSNKEEAVVLTMPKNGQCIIQFNCDDLLSFLNQVGQTPLPPYIQRVADKKDQDRYQTIYAKNNGAIAAPTAGLHFTPQLIETIKQMGIQMVPITLHVGYGTFMPVRVQDIRKHVMHKEYIEISQDSATKIYQAKQNKQRIVAVGTTSVRALEYVYQRQETFGPFKGDCDMFIYPPYSFQVVDSLITNFHLPQSTLFMMIAAFAGRTEMLNVYGTAINEKYRFFSYGDAMMIN